MDFMRDELRCGRAFRARTIVDNYPRECVAFKVGGESRKRPRCDGAQAAGRHAWPTAHNRRGQRSRASESGARCLIPRAWLALAMHPAAQGGRSRVHIQHQRPASRLLSQSLLVSHDRRCAARHQVLAHALQRGAATSRDQTHYAGTIHRTISTGSNKRIVCLGLRLKPGYRHKNVATSCGLLRIQLRAVIGRNITPTAEHRAAACSAQATAKNVRFANGPRIPAL